MFKICRKFSKKPGVSSISTVWRVSQNDFLQQLFKAEVTFLELETDGKLDLKASEKHPHLKNFL